MSTLFPFILGVIFVVINGLTQLVFAQTQGFKLKPSSIGLLIAGVMGLIFGLVTPVTGQSAMIALAGKTEEKNQRVAALLLAAATMTVLGLTGAISVALDFAGPAIIAGMMAGVGIMLTQIGYEFIVDRQKGNLSVGIVSMVSAFVIYVLAFGNPNVLVYVIAGSVLISTVYYILFQHKKMVDNAHAPEGETDGGKFWKKEYWLTEDWKLVRPKFTIKAILSALALICLGVGITTSFGNINAGMAGAAAGLEGPLPQNLNHLTLVSGLAGFASVIFGGMPLETIISGTAAAPWPVMGAFLVLIILAVLLVLGVVSKICRYIPTQSIAGFLVIIGFFSTFLPNLRNPNFGENIALSGTVMGVTALTSNPFLGVLAGVIVRSLGHVIGL